MGKNSQIDLTYTYPIPVEKATFHSRPNRFIVEVKYNNEILVCHLPNPGRMQELLLPNSTVFITFHSSPTRRTKASLVAVQFEDEIIQLQSNLVANWLPQDIANNEVPGIENWKVKHKEFTIGTHRFDFILINQDGEKVITEIKSTTRVKNGVACFPDGVSSRASKHLNALMDLAKKGEKSMVIFVVQRFASSFWPCEQVDPIFTKVFKKALKAPNFRILVTLAVSSIVSKSGKNYIQIKFIDQLDIEKPK